MPRSPRSVLAAVVAVATLAACETSPVGPCSSFVARVCPGDTPPSELDLLFVIDDSGSTTEEMSSFAEQLPRFIGALTSGDRDGDGIADFPPIGSIHVGVVTTDMGSGGIRLTTCPDADFGDDAVLRTQGNTAIPGCAASYPPVHVFTAGEGVAAFADTLSCVAVAGGGGCGWEQQLEAMLKAITPSTQAPVSSAFDGTFFRGTRGHADGANAGLIRPDSLLAVVILTDEEDCSTLDPEVLDPFSTTYRGDLNLRCHTYPEAVHPVERYVDGLLAQRARPDRILYAVVAGVPTDLVPGPSEPTRYQLILSDPRMQEMIDTASPMPRIVPSCDVPGRGIAFAPRRMVEVGRLLERRGAHTVVQSVCQADFTPVFDVIVAGIADALAPGCLKYGLLADATGRVPCDVLETLPTTGASTRCSAIPGRTPVALDPGSGAEICRVTQTPATDDISPAGPGWYYDDFSPDTSRLCGTAGQRIAFTPGHSPVLGATIELECILAEAVPPEEHAVGSPCSVADAECLPGTVVDGKTCRFWLWCDGSTLTWQVPCSDDWLCDAVGLSYYVCDLTQPSSGRCVPRC